MKINLYLEKDAFINIFCWSYIKLLLLYPAMNLHETFWNFVVFSVLTIPPWFKVVWKAVQNFMKRSHTQKKSMIVQSTSFQKVKLKMKYGTCKQRCIVWRKDKHTPAFSSKQYTKSRCTEVQYIWPWASIISNKPNPEKDSGTHGHLFPSICDIKKICSAFSKIYKNFTVFYDI